MNEFMRSILSRVLSEEIGNQRRWAAQDKENGLDNEKSRLNNILWIEEFMKENNIEIIPEYF